MDPHVRSKPRSAMVLTERDRSLLAFAADHRFVLAAQTRALLGISDSAASARLRRLASAGLLVRDAVMHREHAYRITRRGLGAIASTLPAPRPELRSYEHDVGTAWLWLAARSGTWGRLKDVVAERRLRSHDASTEGRSDPFAVRLGGAGPGGRERLHYPDLLLVTSKGHRIALELELSAKSRTRRERIIAGYAADPRIDAVLYLVDERSPQLARSVRQSAAKFGISNRIHVQRFRWAERDVKSSAGREVQRTRARAETRQHGSGRASEGTRSTEQATL